MFAFSVFEDSKLPLTEAELQVVATAAGLSRTGRVMSSTSIDSILRGQSILLRMGAKLSYVEAT